MPPTTSNISCSIAVMMTYWILSIRSDWMTSSAWKRSSVIDFSAKSKRNSVIE
jgi:hypothetical protein